MKCDNCGKEKCDCDKHEKEIQELKSRFVPMSFDEKIAKAEETVRRWKLKEKDKT